MSVKKESTLLEDLNQALAGETLAAFRYLYLSKIANGINSLSLANMFQEIAREEWAHASAFMGRIVQLGGVPVSRPDLITHKMTMDVLAHEAGDEQKLAALLD